MKQRTVKLNKFLAMKNFKFILFLLSIIIFTIISCKKDDITQTDGYVVGFEPCSYITHHIGYVIISNNLKDTLITYNFPDTLFTIPSEYYSDYINTGYFHKEARYMFRTRLFCRVAKGNEIVILGCPTNLNQSEFNHAIQVITISASKYNN